MKTENGNILISEFMDIAYDEPDPFWFKNQHYHQSWDWLMPVIQKCYDIISPMLDGSVDDARYLIGDISNSLLDGNIIDTYNFICDIIQWYNENNK